MANLENSEKDTEMVIHTIEQQMVGRAGVIMEVQQQPARRPSDMGYIS